MRAKLIIYNLAIFPSRRYEIFLSAIGNCFHNCQLIKKQEGAGILFKRLSHDEGQSLRIYI
jgi:hypothetical protein